MKSYAQLKTEMRKVEGQMAAMKKRERDEALRTVKKLCKEFGFTQGMLRGSLAKGRATKAG